MKTEDKRDILRKSLEDYTCLISYSTMVDEIDSGSIYTLPCNFIEEVVLPRDKNSDPFEWAVKCIEKYKEYKVCVLVPGRLFDVFGNRHGRGLGWYDRFLSSIPKHWLRIGITSHKNFSFSEISKNPWDEKVDWVIVCDEDSSLLVYETGARKV